MGNKTRGGGEAGGGKSKGWFQSQCRLPNMRPKEVCENPAQNGKGRKGNKKLTWKDGLEVASAGLAENRGPGWVGPCSLNPGTRKGTEGKQ